MTSRLGRHRNPPGLAFAVLSSQSTRIFGSVLDFGDFFSGSGESPVAVLVKCTKNLESCQAPKKKKEAFGLLAVQARLFSQREERRSRELRS